MVRVIRGFMAGALLFAVLLVLVLAALWMVGVGKSASVPTRTIYNTRGLRCDAAGGSVFCEPDNNLGGYGVAINRSLIIVMRFSQHSKSKIVFQRVQP
jgi:hypothetical protein